MTNEKGCIVIFHFQNVDPTLWNTSRVWQKESRDAVISREEVGPLWKFSSSLWQGGLGLFKVERENLRGDGHTVYNI